MTPQLHATFGVAKARLLHTMLRVRDLDASLDFYVTKLGMSLLRRQDFPVGRFTLAFVGYGPEDATAVVELTHNWGKTDYDLGTGFGHLAIGVADVFGATAALEAAGVRVTRPAGPLKEDAREQIAFVEDPDRYRIELIERRS
jgi:lactoylglutathione lyase